MIRTTATSDTSAIDGLIDLLGNQAEIVAEVGTRVYNRVAPDALAELQREPGEVKRPIQWTSDKQRKFVMAMLRDKFPNGTEYQRTHELSQGWVVKAVTTGNVFSITIENPSPAAKFVYGSLAQNRTAALRFKQKFHDATGWQDATDTASKWTREFVEEFKREWRLEVTTKRRGYTRGTRRAA